MRGGGGQGRGQDGGREGGGREPRRGGREPRRDRFPSLGPPGRQCYPGSPDCTRRVLYAQVNTKIQRII